MPNYAIIPNVSPEDFKHLKAQESKLIERLKSPGVWPWRQMNLVQEIKTSLKYNSRRKMVGIYVEENGKSHLIDKDSDSPIVGSVAEYYKRLLEKELAFMITEDNWIDEIL